MDFSVEKICRLNPDLIIVPGMTDPRKLEKFRELKIPVETFLQPADFRDICGQYIKLENSWTGNRKPLKQSKPSKARSKPLGT